MKITLRKANALQAAINDALKALDLKTDAVLNEFEDVAPQIDAVRDRFWKQANTRKQLLMALYEIRAKVAAANASAGINDMLANVAYAEKQIGFNTSMANKGAQTALRVLNGQLKKNADATGEASYYGRRDVVTSIFTETELELFRDEAANYKREKQKLQDALLDLNVRTEIELTKANAEFLAEANIL